MGDRRSERSGPKKQQTVMSLNSSFSSNASTPSSPLFPSINLNFFLQNCLLTTAGTFSITTFTITSILVLFPLCFLVIYLGLQRWRQQRSSTTISHSDLFTYHMVVAELLGVVGSTLMCCGVHTGLSQMVTVGLLLSSMNISVQMSFHLLTCVERYLAVVHPITYLSLRKAKWIRIRNITIGCIWPLLFAVTGLMFMADNVCVLMIYLCLLAFILTVVSFWSLSVLCVLIRPGPGEGGGDRQRVDQSKLRAFYTIMAILGVLLVRFGGNVFALSGYMSQQLEEAEKSVVWMSTFWLFLPSSLVLPLLFLQRAGKLLCFKSNSESGQGSD